MVSKEAWEALSPKFILQKPPLTLVWAQLVLSVILLAPMSLHASISREEASRGLPDQIGNFRAAGAAQPIPIDFFKAESPEDFGANSAAMRTYISDRGAKFKIELITTASDSGAFALLSSRRSGAQEIKVGIVGTASIVESSLIAFSRGRNYVRVLSADAGQRYVSEGDLLDFARQLAAGLDPSEDDIPVLVRHLPNWQTVQPWARYAVSSNSLEQDVPNQPIMNEVRFEGGTEAVTAYYGPSQLVIVEFTTPQFAGDNDRRIAAKIDELRGPTQPVGTPAPSAYRRVGNYSVFVFNAPDEKTATQLIDQVKYEQVVQWLGDDPYWFQKVQRLYAQTTAGVLIAVVQSSGISLLICLAIGGLLGVVLFRRRRTRQTAAGYSDAGGMVRLNIDEMTEQSDRHKSLGRPEP